jgi:hypothetical protein
MRLAVNRIASGVEDVDVEVGVGRPEPRGAPLGHRPRLPGRVEVGISVHTEPVEIAPILLGSDEPNFETLDVGDRRTDRPSRLHGSRLARYREVAAIA